MADPNDPAITSIGFDARRAKQGADEFKAAGEQIIAVNQKVEASEQKTTETVERTATRRSAARKAAADSFKAEVAAAAQAANVLSMAADKPVEALNRQERRLTSIARAVDPLSVAVRKAANDLEFLERTAANGGPNAARATDLISGAQKRLAEAQRAATIAANDNHGSIARIGPVAKTAEAGMLGATQQSRAMQFALTNLGFQVNDVVTSLASGISPMRTFAQQGGQFVQVFQQGGGVKNILTEVGATLARWATPMTAAVVGLATLGIGIGAAVLKAIELEKNARQVGVALRGMGTQGLASASDIEKQVTQLKALGVAADDARQEVQKVIRTPGLNPGQAANLVTTGANLGAIRGTGTAAGTDELIGALKDGPEALIKLGVELRKLGPQEVEEIRRQNDLAGSVAASDTAYRLLSQRLGGAYTNSLSDSAKAWIELRNAVDSFLVEFSKSGGIQFILDELKGILDGIKGSIKEVQGIIDAFKGVKSAVGRGIDYVTSAGNQATAGAEANRRDMDQALAERDRQAGGTGNVGGAARFDASKIEGNTTALQQLTTVLGEASRDLPAGYGLVATSGLRHGAGGSLHNTGDAIDVQIVDASGRALPNKGPIGSDPGLYKDLAVAAYRANERLFPGTSLTWGGRFETSAGSGMADWMHFDRGVDRGRYGPPLATLAGQTTTSASAADAARAVPAAGTSVFAPVDQTSMLDKQTREYAKANAAARQFADAQVYAEARLRGLEEAQAKGIVGTAALTYADNAAKQAVEQHRIEREKASIVQDKETAGVLKAADAFKISEAAGYRAAAEEQARLEVMQRGGDVANRTRQILEQQAAEAIRAGTQQTAAAQPQLIALEKLADATGKGTQAAHEQNLQNEAALRTQDALAKAEATRNPTLIAQAKALTDAALAEGRRADAARQSISAFDAANDNKLTLAQTSLQTGLTRAGLTDTEIQRRLDYLTISQNLATKFAQAGDDAKKAYADTAIAIADAKVGLANAQREQERWNDLVKDLANTIENELTRSIENAFSENKVESWGKRIQRWLGTATSQLSSSLFIKPALGTVAGALGFGTVAQSLGSFGSIGGLLGTGSGSSGGSGDSITVKKNGDGSLTLSDFASTASLSKTLFGDSGGSSWFSNLGSSLGFATTGKVGAITNAAGETTSLTGTIPGSLFGNTTLSSALGGIGAGFGAGSLLNSLLGGNKLYGSVGSGAGSLLGTGIGSLFGFPILGGITGGLFGSLGGLLGNSHPRSNSSGLFIDLASGTASNFQSSGSAENDKTAREIRDSLTDFTKTLQNTSGGTLSGSISPQATDQGIKLDYNIPGYGSGTYSTKDSQDAIDTAELAIARGLTGISDTMKTVIDQVTDPSKLDAAIAFAKTYDKIADAAKDAFSSIPSDLQTEGPFAKAKDDIKTTFDDIEADAKKFGLSLKPVTDALDEANTRLTKDFNRYTQDLITALDDPLQSLVDIEKRAGDQRLADAKAVNGDIEAVNKLNAEKLTQIWKDQTKDIQDLSDELKTGDLSGLTATQRLSAANDNYKKFLADVQTGKTAEFSDLVTSARNLFSLSTDAYGQGPATAKTRTQLIADLDAVLASRSFASGTSATPPGMILVGENGPELISQPGGLHVYTHRETEKILAAMPSFPREMSFAEGTGDRYLPPPTITLPQGAMWTGSDNNNEAVRLLRDLLTAVNANTTTARVGHYETGQKLDTQTAEMQRPASYEPARRKVA